VNQLITKKTWRTEKSWQHNFRWADRFSYLLPIYFYLLTARPQKMFRQRQTPLSLLTSQCHHQ